MTDQKKGQPIKASPEKSHADSTTSTGKAPTKISRVLAYLLQDRSLNRFEAERLGDHCLHSTISSLTHGYGLKFARKSERVPTGSLCSVGLFVDGKVAALLKPGERVSLHVPAGSVVVGAAYQGSGICGMGADRQEREAIVSGGKVKNYRISTSGDGVLDILPTTL